MRKINFSVCIAGGFETRNFPLPFPVPVGDTEYANIEVEFEPRGDDVFIEATEALRGVMKEKYPGKEYKFYYWWWLN